MDNQRNNTCCDSIPGGAHLIDCVGPRVPGMIFKADPNDPSLLSPSSSNPSIHPGDAPDRVHKEALEAKRDSAGVRYDILVASFEEALARIGHYGAIHYGDFNWQKSRLTGDKGPVNHMRKHLNAYTRGLAYDHPEVGGAARKYHLAAIAFNAMMEFWYEENMPWPTPSITTE